MNTIIIYAQDGTAGKAECNDRTTRKLLKDFLKNDRLTKIEVEKK